MIVFLRKIRFHNKNEKLFDDSTLYINAVRKQKTLPLNRNAKTKYKQMVWYIIIHI